MTLNIVLDCLLFVLLGIAIFYAMRLQAALKDVSKNRHDMEKFVAEFSGSINRAQKAISDLQSTARDVGLDVDQQLGKAQGLRDELTFLVDAADKIATRLTNQTSEAQLGARLREQNRATTDAAPISPAPVDKQKTTPPLSPEKTPPLPMNKMVESVQTKTAVQINEHATEEEASSLPSWAKRLENDRNVINKLPNPIAPPVSGLVFGKDKTSPDAQQKK
jgi:hypothetical protein